MNGFHLKVVAALAAGSFAVPSFCSVHVPTTRSRFAVGYADVRGLGHAPLADNAIVGEANQNSQGGLAVEESNHRALQGKSGRRSETSRRPRALSSHQSTTARRLLFAALNALGIFSAVGIGMDLREGRRGGHRAQGRRAAVPAGLPSHSFPTSFVVGALTLMIIASSLAAPLSSADPPPKSEGGADGRGSRSESLSSPTPATAPEVTSSDSPYTINFDYKGKRFSLKIPDADAKRAGYDKLKELQSTLDQPPRVYVHKEQNVTTRHWGFASAQTPETLGLFHLNDGRQHYLHVSEPVAKCRVCVDGLHRLGLEAGTYEALLTAYRIDQLEELEPTKGLPPVKYLFTNGTTKCVIGYDWQDENGNQKTGGPVNEFTVGHTQFQLLLSKQTERALYRETDTSTKLLDELRSRLGSAPAHFPILEQDRLVYDNAYFKVHWGSGGSTIPFETQYVHYTAFLPRAVTEALKRENNGGWEDLIALVKTAFLEVRRAFVRYATNVD